MTQCIEDCTDGLIFADPVDHTAQVYVFSCYCERGRRYRHYEKWHPVRFRERYRKQVNTMLPKPPTLGADPIPELLIGHFQAGDFISDEWKLHIELYGRERLARWFKAWQNKNP